MGRVARWTVGLLVAGSMLPAGAGAQSFAPRFTTNDNGAIWVTGNTLMTCPDAAPNCAAARAGTASGAALNNNAYAMQYVDVDGGPATFNASTSTFTPPAADEVLFAGLYFGGRLTAGTGGAAALNAAARASVLLRTPAGGAYVPVAAAVIDSPQVAGAYAGFADVTALVRTGGAGAYTVANVQSGTGLDRYAGWALVIAYRDPAQPLRNLTVFDGLASIQQGDPPLSIPVSGFRTPQYAAVRTSVGIVAYEGDRGSSGDRLALNGQLLGDAANPPTNLFNSSVAAEGVDTTGARTPGYVNQLGFDADRIVADGVLPNNETSATFEASTTLDQYLIQVVTFTTALSSPQLEVGKTVADLDGGDVAPGDALRYTVTVRNTGDAGAADVRIADAAPAGTSLASPAPGAVGTLAPGESATATFDVTVDAGAPDGYVIRNVATASGAGATTGRPVSGRSPEVTAVVRRPPVLPPPFDVEVKPTTPEAGTPASLDVTVHNRLDHPIRDVVVTVTVPGADLLSGTAAGRRCSGGGRELRCPVGTLAPGQGATVRLRVRARRPGTLRPVVTVRGDGVAAQRVTVVVRVKAGPPRLTVRKRALSSFGRPGGLVHYRITVRAAASGAAVRGVRLCDEPGAGLRLLGPRCRRLGTLKGGRSATRTVSARVLAASGTVRNVARVRAKNARAAASAATVKVAPATAHACAVRC
ncbi:MAG TPA: NEW3 domain-containing protein [Solirubrobacter sp.]|nr:NEW3 domain-containing protein [Solirubrobacter sp.]